MLHKLKTWPQPFEAVVSGAKRYEVRRDDRAFQVYDELLLQEWNQDTLTYTGREVRVTVTYITAGQFGVAADHVVMSLSEPYDHSWL